MTTTTRTAVLFLLSAHPILQKDSQERVGMVKNPTRIDNQYAKTIDARVTTQTSLGTRVAHSDGIYCCRHSCGSTQSFPGELEAEREDIFLK